MSLGTYCFASIPINSDKMAEPCILVNVGGLSMYRILFVCTGNTCRSPMAEGLMRRLAAEYELVGFEVRSAGVSAFEGSPVSDHAASVLIQKDCTGPERSTLLSQSLIDWADLVLTMTSSHKRYTIQMFPASLDKVFTLKEYVEDDPGVVDKINEMESLLSDLQLKQALAQKITDEEQSRILTLEKELPNHDIADPFGGSLRNYQSCASEIEDSLIKLITKLKASL